MSINTLKVTPDMADLVDIRTPIMNVWYMIAPDAGPCTASEKAELVLDRIEGTAGEEADRLIQLFGYDAVHAMVTMIFKGK